MCLLCSSHKVTQTNHVTMASEPKGSAQCVWQKLVCPCSGWGGGQSALKVSFSWEGMTGQQWVMGFGKKLGGAEPGCTWLDVQGHCIHLISRGPLTCSHCDADSPLFTLGPKPSARGDFIISLGRTQHSLPFQQHLIEMAAFALS